MDGSYGGGGDGDGRGRHPVSGIVTEWNDRVAKVITETGDCLLIHRLVFRLLGRERLPRIGDRVYLMARRQVRVTYAIEELGEVERGQADAGEISRLRALHSAVERRRRGGEDAHPNDGVGIVESTDPESGDTLIRRDDGSPVKLTLAILREAGYHSVDPGSSIGFQVFTRDGQFAYRVDWLDPPPAAKRG